MELGTFSKPPGAILAPNAQDAWQKYGQRSIAYPKQDGWRFQIHVNGPRIVLYSRKGSDYAAKLATTAQQVAQQVGAHRIILDVEMVGYDADDRPLPPGQLLKAHHHRCWVLDMPYLDGQDLSGAPTVERLRRLDDWLAGRPAGVLVRSEFQRFSDAAVWQRFFGQCLQEGLEGAILKLADSDYATPVYKVKPFETIDVLVIAGNRERSGHGARSLKSLLLGVPAAGGQRIAVLGTADRDEIADKALWADIVRALEPLAQDVRPRPIDPTPHLPSTWFAPEIVLEVKAQANRNKIDPHYTVGGGGGPGYRFDRIVVRRLREDKGAVDATTEEVLIDLLTLPPVQSRSGAYQLTLFDAPSPAVHRGTLELIIGCMFSGKSTHLIGRVLELRRAGQNVAVFYPQVDSRALAGHLQTHTGQQLEATSVADASDLAAIVRGRPEPVIAIDEAQFFDNGIVDTCLELVDRGKQVLVAGLDLDFRGVPFGPMPQLLACADRVTKLAATCSVPGCGKPAYFSQRLPGGQPATFFERIVVPGGDNLYQPRCHQHHVVPGKALSLPETGDATGDLASQLWNWVQRLRAIGQIGLLFPTQVYDRERYNEVLTIASELVELLSGAANADNLATLRAWVLPTPYSLSYVTPKVAVAVALFDAQDRILLVQRADDQQWALPGGWADVGYTPADNAASELFQETGLQARCDGLIGVYDGAHARVGVLEESIYTLLFHGRLISGEISSHRHEVVTAQFVPTDVDILSQLTSGTARHVQDAIAYHHTPRPAIFDSTG